jgi:hypothetical protein
MSLLLGFVIPELKVVSRIWSCSSFAYHLAFGFALLPSPSPPKQYLLLANQIYTKKDNNKIKQNLKTNKKSKSENFFLVAYQKISF